MALEAVVFPQDSFNYGCNKDYLIGEASGGTYGFQRAEEERALIGIINNNIEQSLHANWDSSPTVLQNNKEKWDSNSSPETATADQYLLGILPPPPSVETTVTTTTTTTTGRRKRRRTKSAKNKEEIENQRMTHIAVERNRRKQMNEYLAVLRSLMPASYVQRSDQASIIGGAINFVKELEQTLQCMKGQKKTKQQPLPENGFLCSSSPFAEFFIFPQYSTRATQGMNQPTIDVMMTQNQNQSCAMADIEVTLVDSHANIKILSKKQPRQLMKIVVGIQSLNLNILHLNLTTVDDMILTSLSVKVEERCQMNSVDEIAYAVNLLLQTVQEETALR
ncbi:hypothetical protein Lal_00025183 [Lupinus albus]|uniref:Putative transcription factor bHLH family n=1 Tax=Lupinus albus TaxID=3870 RepID=A0A6A4PWS7_LUPAL|nr:putative transcription factor bHLH family [Lupinus albus]KAF1889854.1 hypothetical protein Lal_00025183 [Lupinus albus]